MDELSKILQDSRADLQGLHREVSSLTRAVTDLVRALEQEDRLRERAERAEERAQRAETQAQDSHRERMEKAIEDVKVTSEGIGRYMRELPQRTLRHIEKKVYELRTARWEAMKAGADTTTPPEQYREQTGKIAVARLDPEDRGRRSFNEIVGGAVISITKKGWPYALAAASSTGFLELLHRLHVFK